ncbi:MAG: transposase family protein, partial [Flavobacterium sp.]|nr:transposase family protein [Flavobacterium sp.]
MNVLSQFSKNLRIFQRTVGLSAKQFDLFLLNFEIAFRALKSDVGRPYSLSCRDLLTVILMYYKSYMTQEFIGCLVGINQSNISRLLTKTRELIELVADPELKTYVEKIKQEFDQIPLQDRINDFQTFFKKYPEMKEVITDATEQKCFRSKKNDIQKVYYSGKKKQHTRKTQITISKSGKILDVSATYPGSVHDKTIIDQEQTVKK